MVFCTLPFLGCVFEMAFGNIIIIIIIDATPRAGKSQVSRAHLGDKISRARALSLLHQRTELR